MRAAQFPTHRVICMLASLVTAARRSPQGRYAVAMVSLIAILVALVIATTANNFRLVSGQRSSALGGDFLQEWVGGYLIASGDAAALYDPVVSDRLQHDASLVGFQWPDSEYYPMVYPPAWYALVSPIAHLSYPLACYLWLALMATTLPVIAALMSRGLRIKSGQVIAICIGIAAFPPAIQSLVMGQKSLLWLAIWVGVVVLCRSGKPRWAGTLFGLMLMKPILVPVLIGMMAARKQWAFVVSAAISAATIAAISLLVVPASTWIDYCQVVAGVGSYHQTAGYSSSLAQNLGSLLRPLTAEHRAVYWSLFAATGAIVVVFMARVARIGQRKTDLMLDDHFWIATVLGTILLSPHYFAYDLTLLGLVPIALACHGRIADAGPWIVACFIATAVNDSIVQTLGFPPTPVVLMGMLVWYARSPAMLVAGCPTGR